MRADDVYLEDIAVTINEDASANAALAQDTLSRISLLRRQTERLSSKERALMAFAHQEPDRVPIDLWVADEVQQDLVFWVRL